ncbi:triacylglycerol lipase [Emticicia sp. C21]|uniref:esterase/lipase family protein n=1 Tax=Emticicia sp. C21 TaxID=2302915 RepID=UPI000E34116E|nr:hypothetical protein [Emticicia sp. C21]RFS15557.1 hypothetical protein D0T08_15515 [Emticicia sp. C21]
MKKLYSYTLVYFAVFVCLHFNVFAKTTDEQPLVLKPTPVKALPIRFKPLPFRPLHLTKVDLYQFDQKAYVFGKITSAFPVLSAQEWKTVSNDPVRFTLTPNKQTAYVGEEIELTLTAELLNISPTALFTFEELREYTLKVVLPSDFIQTGGTYYDFMSDRLDGGSTKKIYTIKGRYLATPALDDCFKVLRKLNNEVFVLKNTQCPTITEVDVASVKSEEKQPEKTREIATIDLNKINYFNTLKSRDGNNLPLDENQLTIKFNCLNWRNYFFAMSINMEGALEIIDNGGSVYWEITQKAGSTVIAKRIICDLQTIESSDSVLNNTTSITSVIKIYNSNVCPTSTTIPTATPVYSKTITYTIDRTPCPPPNFTITASSTAICSGNSAVLEASSNCPSANVSWKKDNAPFGNNGSSLLVNGPGSYKAECSNPIVISNSISINVSTIPPIPTVTFDKNALTPGESAQLIASNCSGTILWTGPNNFADTGNQISVNKSGGYNAKCKTTCIQNNVATDYYSGLSVTINISVAPLRIQADKSQIRPGESVTVTAYGCTNGYIKWKINDNLQPTTENPFTFNSSGFYSASCNSWDGTYASGWVQIFIHQLPANTPTIAANKIRVYNNENVTLTATGCTTYYWVIPVLLPNGSYSTPNPVTSGPGWTATGPATYQVGCTNTGPWAYVTVGQMQPGNITITSNKTVANTGEAVEFNITGDCPSNAGIQWKITGENSWTTRYESKTVYGPGTYEARCIIDNSSYGSWASIRINAPSPGGITISTSKTSAGGSELVTLRANGCNGEVVWTLPNNTEVRGTSILFATGPGTYKARCVRFGITGTQASIVIQTKSNDAPRFYATQSTASGNQIFQLVAENCPNNYVQWGVPKQDANGNTYYDYANFFPTLIVRGPGTYQVRCNEGNHTSFQDIVIFPNPSDALTIVANKAKALPSESVVLTAFGCPNGTVQWEIGGVFIPGVQFSTIGPGNYKARCVGDPTNNGDYAIASILPIGSIVPVISSTHNTACPGESVTLTALNYISPNACPTGWPIQWQYVKDDKIDYWLNNRNAIENFGENYGEVFETISANSISKTGPRVYYVRCLKPDLTWIGEFKDKSFIVEPVFPEYLRASNNGPALIGATGIKVAVTEVPGPNITYAWAGPSGFTSGSRIADVTGLTEAKSGVYTVTVSKTGTNGCSVTATTNLVVNGCNNLKIKAINPLTGLETYELPRTTISSSSEYDPLVLIVVNSASDQVQNLNFNWKDNNKESISITDQVFVRKEGLYTVDVNSTSFNCSLAVKVDEVSYQESLDWAFYPLDKTKITTGILYDRVLPIAKLATFNTTGNISDTDHFQQAYSEIYKSSYNKTQLLSREDYKNVVGDYKYQKKVAIGLVIAKFNVFLDNALTSNILIKKDNQLFDNPNNANSAYATKNVIVSAALADEISTGVTKFILSPYTFINNSGNTLNKLRVSFGDGNPVALMSVGDEVNVTYTTAGQKTITFTAEFTNGTTQTTYAYVKAKTYSLASEPDSRGGVEAKIDFIPYVTEDFSNVKGKGEIAYYNNVVNGVKHPALNKVAIVLDGFDAGDTRGFNRLYDEKMVYGNNQNIIEDLKADGYDVIVLNFPSYPLWVAPRGWRIMRDGGADYIERNAFVLVELIEQVKIKLAAAGSNERIVIIGPSMGGLISRYALTYMEKNNLDHRCKLWVSFDSPHRGANINIGDQLLFEYLNRSLGWVGAVEDAMAQLDAVAAKQMLLHHYTAILDPQFNAINPPDIEKIAGSPNFRTRFVETMENMGFPTSSCIRNVALINGSDLGTIQQHEQQFLTTQPASCSQAMNITIGVDPVIFISKLLFNNSGPFSVVLTTSNSPSYNNRCRVLEANVNTSLFSSKKYSRFVKGNGISNSLDIIAGGYYAVNDEIPTVHALIASVTKRFSKQSFIPSYSSMAIAQVGPVVNYIDWGSNLSSYRNNPLTNTPFKAIYAPTTNQEHVFITAAGVNFIKQQILLTPCN